MEKRPEQIIADAYGFPFLLEDVKNYVPEDQKETIKRIAFMKNEVTLWISENRRIPSTNPNAAADERTLGHWLKVLQFFTDVTYDPENKHGEEMLSCDHCHAICQHAIRTGELTEDP